MAIGERLQTVREQNLSQGDIEKHTGLLRVYISRVENGHTVPAIGRVLHVVRQIIGRAILQTVRVYRNEERVPEITVAAER